MQLLDPGTLLAGGDLTHERQVICLLQLSFRGLISTEAASSLQDDQSALNHNPTHHFYRPSHGYRRVNTAQLLAAPPELDCTRCKAVRNCVPGRSPDEHPPIMATPSTSYTR